MTEVRVPYVALRAQFEERRDELLAAVERVLASGHYVMGPEVEQFEESFASLCGAPHAVAVANGTDALWLVLRALGIGAGDEVITVSNSFIATAGAVVASGARPVFVDVGDDYNIDARLVESAVTPRTRALLPVHLTGRPAAMDQLTGTCRRHGLALIEDAAQAAGARFDGQPVGSFGAAGCFSLHPLKNLNACGDAGVVTTSDAALADKLRRLRNHGLRNRDECDFWAFNSRLDAVQAAILNVRLRHLDQVERRRRDNAAYYRDRLPTAWLPPPETDREHAVYHTFVIALEEREALQAHLAEAGVETRVHYPIPIHLQTPGLELGYRRGDLPVTERLADQILSLPVHELVSDEQRTYVADRIQAFAARSRG